MADGRPMKFLSLGVTIHDGSVYKTRDARPLGPLAGAMAQYIQLPPVWRRLVSTTLVGFPEKQQVPRVRVTVRAGGAVHSKEIEGRLAISGVKNEVKRFNAAVEASKT
jgi:hypothetical protein